MAMTFSLSQLVALMVSYLSLLFAVGFAAERQLIPQKILDHPLIYVLSLGVFSGALGIFGASELAYNFGHSFLLYYLGVVVMFLLSPLILSPMLRICRTYQLGSLADLLSFRFQSPWVGTAVTIMLLAAIMPLLALQIQAVTDSIHILYEGANYPRVEADRHHSLALLFCATITLFTMLFGSRSPSSLPRQQGLVATIAFESIIKLVGMMILGSAAIFSVFGGFDGLQNWLESSPEALALLNSPLRQDSARALLLIFFASTVTMPHIFHMIFAEKPGHGFLRTASWGLPLYLLLLALPILPITWAGMALSTGLPTAYSALALGIAGQSTTLSMIGFMTGLSAASAVIIVSTLALANMCLNHIVLPAQLRSSIRSADRSNIYEQLTWLRRLLAAGIILLGYLFYRVLEIRMSLLDVGLVAFVGTLQFLPAIFATLFWPRANRHGLLAGLSAGFAIWFLALLLPLISGFQADFVDSWYLSWFAETEGTWSATAILSLASNISLFITVSLLTPTSESEHLGAAACSVDDLDRPMRRELSLHNAEQYRVALAAELGDAIAERELQRALQSLSMPYSENRPIALRRLREKLSANLSGLLGPTVASEIIQRSIPFREDNSQQPEDISLIESSLDQAQSSFSGLAADLDNLRRHHRETLHELPIGVFSLGGDGEVLMWNRIMEKLTGVEADEVVGSLLSSLPVHWAEMFQEFANSKPATEHKLQMPKTGSDNRQGGRWISLHKTVVQSPTRGSSEQLIVVEDVTNYRVLEQELLHSERLASIGRLAAGVAHEIGNPVTGIACLAQNLEFEQDANEVRNAASEILQQTNRVTRIVESLVNFSHTGKNNPEPSPLLPTNLADCIDEAVHLLQLDRNARPVRYSNLCDREHLVLADSQKLLQVFINLLSNARDASADGQSIEIDSLLDPEQVEITVTDEGSGVAADIQEQIFEPFFTTKDPGMGTGLGLPLVYSILEDMNGRIHLTSPVTESGGTRFNVILKTAEYAQEYL
jgi:PAS domain S-box-containing protein